MSLTNTNILPNLYSGLSSPDSSPPDHLQHPNQYRNQHPGQHQHIQHDQHRRLPPHAAFSPPDRSVLGFLDSPATATTTTTGSDHPFGAYPFPLQIAESTPGWDSAAPNSTRSTRIGIGYHHQQPSTSPRIPAPTHRHHPLQYDTLSDSDSDSRNTIIQRTSPPSAPPSPTMVELHRALRTSDLNLDILPTPDGTTHPHVIETVTLGSKLPPTTGRSKLLMATTPNPNDIRADSLTRSKAGHLPVLEHLLSIEQTRKLSLAVDGRYIYSGSQSDGITVFSRDDLRPIGRLEGHRGSVLCLLLVEEKKWLISGGSDGTVRVWDTETLRLIKTVVPAYKSSGDIFCLGWDKRGGGTLYFGAQSTDVEFITAMEIEGKSGGCLTKAGSTDGENGDAVTPKDPKACHPSGGRSTLTTQAQRFFASRPASPGTNDGTTTAHRSSSVGGSKAVDSDEEAMEVTVPGTNVVTSAHYGYVYGMEIVNRPDGGAWLCTGSGDEDIKVWDCLPDGGGLKELMAFTEVGGAVLSLASRESLLYAGLQGGLIKIWDLETRVCIRTIMIHKSDVMTITMIGSDAYTAGGDGRILRLDGNFDCTASFEAHAGAVFATAVCREDVEGGGDKTQLITTGHDSFIKVWGIPPQVSEGGAPKAGAQSEGDVLLYALAKFISIQTVSGDTNREQCRQGAHFLRKFLEQLGAEAKLVPNKLDGKNPVVVATFKGYKPSKRVLFYGHYDVVNTHENDWKSNPFELSARNGYLYGRGVADDKGPIIAMACAVASLREQRQLNADVVMVIEGEEESGSPGFGPTMEGIKADIGPIDVILLSNSSWITDEDPCIVWGMRGILQAQLDITGAGRDAHSGVDGGVVPEPMLAMVSLLHELHNQDKVRMPNFYSDVREMSSEESELYEQISDITGQDKKDLISKWRAPTFSVASITSSGPASNTTVIPRSVTANVSFRLVPNQSLEIISAGLEAYCYRAFGSISLKGMRLNVRVTHQARWWLASLDNFYFKKLEESISDVWGRNPLKIREGGSIPTIPFLEGLFDAPCVHLPMGQKSSAAHLANERLKLSNLRNGKKVMETFLKGICDKE